MQTYLWVINCVCAETSPVISERLNVEAGMKASYEDLGLCEVLWWRDAVFDVFYCTVCDVCVVVSS